MKTQSEHAAKIAVAMSGGVDSAVAAALLKEQGYDVIGITLRLFCYGDADTEARSCCSLEAIEAARGVARLLEIPHYVLDFEEEFDREVVDPFCREYGRGRTPNPCVLCNSRIKFKALVDRVNSWGIRVLATGHYARITCDPGIPSWHLLKGCDAGKDQSYFLWGIPGPLLPELRFPLGELTKSRVRALARRRGLQVAERRESQEVCFSADWKEFLRSRLHLTVGDSAISPGLIVNSDGRHLGQHRGVAFYTIGQRSRIGVATGKPLYVVGIDPHQNVLTLGEERELFKPGLVARDISWINDTTPPESSGVTVKIRYRHPGVAVTLSRGNAGEVTVRFDTPQRAITPGQSVVFYDGEEVLGGGVIDRAL